jgi:hypothetical protein
MATKETLASSAASGDMLTLIGIDDFASMAGVKPNTIRQFRWRGILPPPDGFVQRSPYWLPETVALWIANRRRAEDGRPRK